VGLTVVCARLKWRPALSCAAVGLVLFALAYRWQEQLRRRDRNLVELRARGYREGHRAVADWLGQLARPGETVAIMDIGLIGFYCPQLRILDITGLTDRFIAKSPGAFLDKEYDPDYVFSQRPEFLVLAFRGAARAGPIDLEPWSGNDRRLAEAPQFAARYFRVQTPTPDAPALKRLAAQLGAERVFQHAYPGTYYFLAVYGRHD